MRQEGTTNERTRQLGKEISAPGALKAGGCGVPRAGMDGDLLEPHMHVQSTDYGVLRDPMMSQSGKWRLGSIRIGQAQGSMLLP